MSSRLLLSFVLLCCWFNVAVGSQGDRDPLFVSCVNSCSSQCHVLSASQLNDNWWQHDKRSCSDFSSNLPVVVTASEAPSWSSTSWLHWPCPQECTYRCMRAHDLYRTCLHLDVDYSSTERHSQRWWHSWLGYNPHSVKYFGKWPFVRFFGVQELLSTLFSVINALPHAVYALQYYRSVVPARYSMYRLWLLYGVTQINTWIWSTAFHARDLKWTERADYYCASFGIATSVAIQIMRTWRLTNLLHRSFVFLVLYLLLTMHVSYLEFVHFDYGWNMLVSLSAGITYSVLFVGTALYEQRPYRNLILLSQTCLWLAASFEVFDFAPLFGLLDAHALWHGLTPAVSIMIWRVLILDSLWEHEMEKSAAFHLS